MRVILVRIWPRIFGSSSYASRNRYASNYAGGSKGFTGNASQGDTTSKNRSAARNSWKPKFSKRPNVPDDGPFSQHHQSRLERIDSNDDATELRPTTYKTQITSSAGSDHGSIDGHRFPPQAITVSRDVTIKY